jgi:flagellar basal body-associated protein FliL
MSATDKKRLIWILIAIFFLFANMTLVVIMLIGGNSKRSSDVSTQPVATQ